MFRGCESIISLPDISKWDTSNVEKMCNLFEDCKLLFSLPDISKWNISKVRDFNELFIGCKDSLNISSKFKIKDS